MNEWHDLFVATAGAAAALTGLLFVGVSINLTRILASKKLPERALLALLLLLAILIISILLLIPSTSLPATGVEVLVCGLVLWLIVTAMDTGIYRNTDLAFKRVYAFHIFINQAAMLPYLAGGVLLLFNKPAGLYFVVAAFIACFIKAMMDAWVLLVEINR